MRIRPVRIDDSAALAEIVVEGWRWAYQGVISDAELADLDVAARMRRFEERFDADQLFLVAVDEDDMPIGFAVESNPPQLPHFDSEIAGLYVAPTRTRTGAGRTLVGAMVEKFVARGAQTMAIHTLQQNKIGRSFYERMGGVVVEEDIWRTYPAVWYGWFDLDTAAPRAWSTRLD